MRKLDYVKGDLEALDCTDKLGNKLTCVVYHDMDAENPRDWSNIGTFVSNCNGADITADEFYKEHGEYIDRKKGVIYEKKDVIYEDVYMYRHGSVRFNTSGFNCSWDSGCVGFIYVTKEDLREEFKWERITKEREKLIRDILRAEIEIFSYYANGDTYGYQIEDSHGEIIDACSGFYGDTYESSGLLEHASELIDFTE